MEIYEWICLTWEAEGKAVAEACGGAPAGTSQALTPIDIGRIERQLAPLLAADLHNNGSSAVPRQYYRQYGRSPGPASRHFRQRVP